MAIKSYISAGDRGSSLADDNGGKCTSNKSSKAKLNKDESPYLWVPKNIRAETRAQLPPQKTAAATTSCMTCVASDKCGNQCEPKKKKIRKSVLTLPNYPAPAPRDCVVSETNDSGYFNYEKRPKLREPAVSDQHRLPIKNHGTAPGSVKLMRRDVARKPKSTVVRDKPVNMTPPSIWSMLRDLKRFQYEDSPPTSEIDISTDSTTTKKFNVNNLGVTETINAEYEFDVCTKGVKELSGSSSECVTVIDKNDMIYICQEVQKTVKGTGSGQCLRKNRNQRLLKQIDGRKDGPKLLAGKSNMKACKDKTSGGRLMLHNEGDTGRENVYDVVKSDYQLFINNPCDSMQSCALSNSTSKGGRKASLNDIKTIHKSHRSFDSCPFNGREDKLLYNAKVTDSDKRYQKSIYYEEVAAAYQIRPPDPHPREKLQTKSSKHSVSNQLLDDEDCSQEYILALQANPCKKTDEKKPYFTKNEIKKRLAQLKYPLVVLRKEEVRPVKRQLSFESVQFDGVDRHVWQFMKTWSPEWNNLTAKTPPQRNAPKPNYHPTVIPILEQSHFPLTPSTHPRKKLYSKNNDDKQDTLIPRGSIATLTDKMVRFLYKNLPENPELTRNLRKVDKTKIPSTRESSAGIRTEIKKTNYMSRSTYSRLDAEGYEEKSVSKSKKYKTKRQNVHKSEEKETNQITTESVESIMLKIESGIYSSHKIKKETNEVETTCDIITAGLEQLEMITGKAEEVSNVLVKSANPELSMTQRSSQSSLFDFSKKRLNCYDEALLKLELKTLNPKKIAIQNRDTNIMVQFDVVNMSKVDDEGSKVSLTCIPVNDVSYDGETKVFKSKNTLMNAALPAELCTIFPMMMKKMLNMQSMALDSTVNDAPMTQLLMIKEAASNQHCEVSESITSSLSPGLQKLANGIIRPVMQSTLIQKRPRTVSFKDCKSREGLLNVSMAYVIFTEMPLYDPIPIKKFKLESENKLNKCKAIVPYVKKSSIMTKINHDTRILSFLNLMNSYILSQNIKLTLPCMVTLSFGKENSLLKNDKLMEQYSDKTLVLHFNKNAYMSSTEDKLLVENKSSTVMKWRKKFLQLHKCCKSSSNISCERSSTLLSRISNAEEFIQALGASKTLASVLDAEVVKKILKCVTEMKAWKAEIRPQQALLILLLCNRKDTATIMKFRTVLVQGIAVNRITKTSELDMEIDVLENENVHNDMEYPTEVPSPEEENDLYEELCWIAKTTASDYQKSFDASSEKLLKSLLQKRRKLNPSYLRVMARYVGLGLLRK